MASISTFERWEKDPLFSAAEEVQESADRMESTYRRWIREKNRNPAPDGKDDAAGGPELRRELHAALGTTKWQLEEFDRASLSTSNPPNETEDDKMIRHGQFVESIGNQILVVEDALRNLEIEDGRTPLVWVNLDEEERDELAMFLSGPLPVVEQPAVRLPPLPPKGGIGRTDMNNIARDFRIHVPQNSFDVNETGASYSREDRKTGHRRSASVGADLGTWKNLVSDEYFQIKSPIQQPGSPLPRVISFSGLSTAAESTWKVKWMKNGFRKWKLSDQHHPSDSIPLKSDRFSRGLKTFYERSKSCLSDCGDESYNKHLYGCLGNFQRQLQRSQYKIKYRRPIQVIFWLLLAFLLIVIFTIKAF